MKLNTNRFYISRMPVLVAAVLFYASTAFSAVPQIINYQGSLSDSGGNPVNATLNITFTFYDAETLGTALWQEVQSVDITNGVFNVQLGADTAGNPLDPAFFEDPLFLGIAVGGDAEMTPRQELAAVGYAFRAKSVENDTLNSLSCANGEVPKWNGSAWVCSGDDNSGGDITGVTAGTGLTGGGTSGDVNIDADTSVLQARVSGACPAGQSIRTIDAKGGVICEVDTDTNTTYSAGPGLALNGTTFSIPPNGISTPQIDTGAVTQDKIADNSVSSGKIQSNSITGAKIQNGTLTGLDIAQSNSIVAGHLAPGSVGVSELSDLAKGVGVNGTIIVQAGQFRPVSNSTGFNYSSSGYVASNALNAIVCLQAPVYLPDGVTVNNFEISVWDNSVNDAGFTLRRTAFDTGLPVTMGSASTSGASSGARVFSDNTIVGGTINGSLYGYHITGCVVGDPSSTLNFRFYGARISYN